MSISTSTFFIISQVWLVSDYENKDYGFWFFIVLTVLSMVSDIGAMK